MLPAEAGCDDTRTVKKVYCLQSHMNVMHMFLYVLLIDVIPTIIFVQVRLYKLIETGFDLRDTNLISV